ncbi:hypothetical protein ACFX2G_026087 [Malus domestica]
MLTNASDPTKPSVVFDEIFSLLVVFLVTKHYFLTQINLHTKLWLFLRPSSEATEVQHFSETPSLAS